MARLPGAPFAPRFSATGRGRKAGECWLWRGSSWGCQADQPEGGWVGRRGRSVHWPAGQPATAPRWSPQGAVSLKEPRTPRRLQVRLNGFGHCAWPLALAHGPVAALLSGYSQDEVFSLHACLTLVLAVTSERLGKRSPRCSAEPRRRRRGAHAAS